MLEEKIRAEFIRHVEKRGAMIMAPERLLDEVLAVVAKWLQREEQLYREHEMEEAADALKGLRFESIRTRIRAERHNA